MWRNVSTLNVTKTLQSDRGDQYDTTQPHAEESKIVQIKRFQDWLQIGYADRNAPTGLSRTSRYI